MDDARYGQLLAYRDRMESGYTMITAGTGPSEFPSDPLLGGSEHHEIQQTPVRADPGDEFRRDRPWLNTIRRQRRHSGTRPGWTDSAGRRQHCSHEYSIRKGPRIHAPGYPLLPRHALWSGYHRSK